MLTRDDFLDLFWYDELSGKLHWQLPLHPRIKIGSEAGTPNGKYRHVKIDGKYYRTHRIIWVMLFGDIPNDKIIDHKNYMSLGMGTMKKINLFMKSLND